MLRAFPVLTHTTLLNEIRVMQEMGYPIRVFSILEPDPSERRDEAADQLPPVTYCWTQSARAGRTSVIKANLSILARVGPGVYRRAFELARRGGLVGNWRAFMRLAYRADEMRRQGVTHLHAHWATEGATAALIFSWLTRLPFSFTAHAYDIFRSPQFLELKLREARFVVTVSQYNKQYIAQHFGPDAADKIHVIYPLIDLSQFPLRPPLPDERLTIVCVGRLTEQKGLIDLVETCRILKERGLSLTCQIAGQGEERPALEAAVRRYGLESHVKLLGALPHHAIPPLLEQATLFALPCVIARNGSRDGMPLVLIEAMARGVPVVSSDILGLPELVRDGAGLLAPPHNPAALADAIQHIAQLSPEARDAMGRAGRRIVEDFDAVKGATRLLELIHSVRDDQTTSLSAKKTARHVTPTV
ncbi:MAG: glycosyltransferase family 4 protein [Anaerolineae bacterium]